VAIVLHQPVVHNRIVQFINDLALVGYGSAQGHRFLSFSVIVVNAEPVGANRISARLQLTKATPK
jgi:hypothetical protein